MQTLTKPKTVKLTETSCKNAPSNAKLWDSEVKGFALFTGKQTKTFYFQKDVNGKTTRAKIGNFPDVPAGVARGEPSSRSTTRVATLIEILDPRVGAQAGEPGSEDDLVVTAYQSAVMSFDNVETFPRDGNTALTTPHFVTWLAESILDW